MTPTRPQEERTGSPLLTAVPPQAAPAAAAARDAAEPFAIDTCWSPALSPDGRTVAFLADDEGCPKAYLSPVELWAPRQIASGPEEVVHVDWSGDGGMLALTLSPGGDGRTRLHVTDAAGEDGRPLFAARSASTFPGVWAPTGRAFAFSTTAGCAGSDCTALVLDLAASTLLPLASAQEQDGRMLVTDVSADHDRSVLRVGSRGRRALVVVDRLTGTRAELMPTGAVTGSAQNGWFSADGDAVWFRTDVDREYVALAFCPLDADGRPGPPRIAAERVDGDLDVLAFSGDRRTAVLVWNVAGVSALEVLDAGTGERAAIALPPDSETGGSPVVDAVSIDATGRFAVLDLSTARRPRGLWLLELGTGALRPLGAPPQVRQELVAPSLERFSSHDGLALTAWLYRAPGAATPGPMVLSFHGGPEAQERPVFNALFQALLAAGVSVLAPNVRGSTGYGRTFEDLDSGARRFDAIADVAACARFVIDAGVADPAQLGIHGSSYGGYLVLAGITGYPDLFAAAVDVCGIASFESFFSHTEPWMATTSRHKYGDPVRDRQLLRELSPLHRIDRVRTPTMVVHGVNDTNVPVAESEQVIAALAEHDVPHRALLLADEGHCLRGREARAQVLASTVDWFVTQLDPTALRAGSEAAQSRVDG